MNDNLVHQFRTLGVASPEVPPEVPVTASSGNVNTDASTFRVASPSITVSPSPEQNLQTPSVHVTPVPSSSGRPPPQTSNSDSLVDSVHALRIDESPTPSRRRRSRSGTGVQTEIHIVENETPPDSLFHSNEVQEALRSTGPMIRSVANRLANSELHREPNSRVQGLHQQALKLQAFELPSSRIVGLIGDSGVGKSSLINCLLDKEGLARTVSVIMYNLPVTLLTGVNRAAAVPRARVSLRSTITTMTTGTSSLKLITSR
jgi:ABC-type multidrug transport system fused ATPase/permease subunit